MTETNAKRRNIVIIASLALIAIAGFVAMELLGDPGRIQDDSPEGDRERVVEERTFVDSGGSRAAEKPGEEIAAGSESDEVAAPPPSNDTVASPDGEGIVGVLLDSTGAPIARANVMAHYDFQDPVKELEGEIGALTERVRELRVGPGNVVSFGSSKRTITDRQGRFAIRDLKRDGAYRVKFQHPSHPTHEVSGVTWTAGSRIDVGEVTMPRPARVFGYVRDTNGQPIEGAHVRRRESADADAGTEGAVKTRVRTFAFAVAGLGGDEIVSFGGGGSKSEPTDAEGYFEMRNVAPGLYDIIAKKSGLAEGIRARLDVSEGSEAGPVTITLEKGLEIIGHVFDSEGKGVIGAMISARTESGSSTHGRTGGEGEFRLTGLSKGSWNLSAFTPGTGAQGYAKKVAAGSSGVRITMAKPIGLSGRIVDGAGEPVDGARLSLKRRAEEGSPGGVRMMSATWGGGKFTFHHVPEGTYDVEVTGRGIRATSAGPYTIAGRTLSDIEIRVERE